MRRHLSLLITLPLAASVYVAGCLSDSDSDGTSGAGGASGSTNAGTGGTGANSGAGGSATMGSGGSTAGGSGGGAGAGGAPGPDPSQNEANKDADPKYVTYLDNLTQHPGCTVEGLKDRLNFDKEPAGYDAAVIPNYPCAAKAYDASNVNESKPIVVLVHGNSSTPMDYEKYPAGSESAQLQLSERLVADGFRVYAADFRFDKVPFPDPPSLNAAQNFDHGWATPILQSMLGALFQQYPDRKISLVGFSLGTTIIRDTMRRMHRANQHPFEHVKDLVLLAGGNHGVSSYTALCGNVDSPANPTLRGIVACQLGDIVAYTPVPFHVPLNGPDGAFEAPCVDGLTAYGQDNVCGNNAVQYTTIVMKDPTDGTIQDEFVSVTSSTLKGADNQTVEISDEDTSGYFLGGALNDHYGAVRSPKALDIIMSRLND